MAKNSYDWDNGVLTFSNAAGKTTFALKDVPESCHGWLMEYGLKQWLGSFMAKAANGTAKDYLETAKAALARAKAGEFVTRGTGLAIDALMPRAFQILAAAKGLPEAKAAEWLGKYEAAEEDGKEAIRKQTAVKAAIESARAERKLSAPAETETPFELE